MRILFAEDDPISRRMLAAVLGEWGYEVVVTCDGGEAWQVLQHNDTPQLAILDWMMPRMDGLQLCRRVRQLEREPYIYILLLTARVQKEDLVVGLEAGADDYLTKPFDPQELRVRLRAGRRILNLQTELISAREALREQATRDPLTRLWNRTVIFDLLRRELARAEREGVPVGVVMADIDHFKRINDTYGHLTGDAVLCEVARRMSAFMRPYDGIGRYGGEEFLFVLPGCDAQKAVQVAKRLHTSVEENPPETPEGRIPVTVSFGVTAYGGIGETDMKALLHAADSALYRAKQSGRNRVVLDRIDDVTAT